MKITPGPAVRGDVVLHPVAVVSLAVLLLNDHVLKAATPGWVTGKLSDVAGLAFFPFLVLALSDVVLRRRPGARAAAAVGVATAGVFAAVKLIPVVRDAAAVAAGWLRTPLDALLGLGSGAATWDPVRPAVIVGDPTDVAAVLACAAAWLVVRRSDPGRHEPGPAPVGHPALLSAQDR